MKKSSLVAALLAAVVYAVPGSAGIVSQVRVGALDHASKLVSSGREDGVDANLEVVFAPIRQLWSAHPYLGTSFNFDSQNTDQLYAGFAWEGQPWRKLYLRIGFGAAVHNGELLRYNKHVRGLGNRVLIHAAGEAGWRISERYDVSLYYQHLSNGPFHGKRGVNDGLDNIGLRVGYHFE